PVTGRSDPRGRRAGSRGRQRGRGRDRGAGFGVFYHLRPALADEAGHAPGSNLPPPPGVPDDFGRVAGRELTDLSAPRVRLGADDDAVDGPVARRDGLRDDDLWEGQCDDDEYGG